MNQALLATSCDLCVQEQHVIYAVDYEEFHSCRVAAPSPRIVAKCTQPDQPRSAHGQERPLEASDPRKFF